MALWKGQDAARTPEVILADVFSDAPYHRSNFLLVSSSETQVRPASGCSWKIPTSTPQQQTARHTSRSACQSSF